MNRTPYQSRLAVIDSIGFGLIMGAFALAVVGTIYNALYASGAAALACVVVLGRRVVVSRIRPSVEDLRQATVYLLDPDDPKNPEWHWIFSHAISTAGHGLGMDQDEIVAMSKEVLPLVERDLRYAVAS